MPYSVLPVKLYYFPVAPNPTKVRVYLAEKGIALDTVRVNLGEGEQKSPEHLARNPRGKLPVLELDDGTTIAESLPIIEYLEELHPNPVMIGSTPAERAQVRAAERLVDTGVMLPVGIAVHATRSPLGLPANPAVADWAVAQAHLTLALVDERLADAPFVAGARVTIADCTLWAALAFGGFFGFDFEAETPHVSRWKKTFDERPSTTLPA
jgi:glutathione S-transferase